MPLQLTYGLDVAEVLLGQGSRTSPTAATAVPGLLAAWSAVLAMMCRTSAVSTTLFVWFWAFVAVISALMPCLTAASCLGVLQDTTAAAVWSETELSPHWSCLKSCHCL